MEMVRIIVFCILSWRARFSRLLFFIIIMGVSILTVVFRSLFLL